MENFNHKLVWLVVISSILLSVGGTRYAFSTNFNLADHPFYGIFLDPFDNIRYGHYIAKKLFLVAVAFLVLGYWTATQKNIIRAIRSNIKYIVFIGLTLFLSRILTFGFWFYNDDTRLFHYHLFAPTQPDFNVQGMWGPIGSHPFALLVLVIRWFGTNYTLYNALGLLFYFLAGIAIFALVNKLQKSKFVSFIASVFLLTTPTYFQGRLLIGEVINSPFVLLLVILSLYMVLQRFIPGALIFAAAALEYGVAKTYFIALPLTLFAVFFASLRKKILIFFVAAIFLISLVYLPAFGQAPSSAGKTLTLDQLFVFGDVLMSVTLPHGLSYPLVHLLSLLLNGWIYITASLGFLIIGVIAAIAFISKLRGKTLSAKLIIIGLSIILPTTTIASFMGVRVEHNVAKLVEYHNRVPTPSGATGYGIFPALGLTLILVGLSQLIRRQTFAKFAIFLILLDIVTSFSYDYKWLQSDYSYPQRRYDDQLQKILPKDGIDKYIYVPSKQRPLYQSVITFGSIFQGDQGIYTFDNNVDFVQKIKEDKAQKDHIYFLITSGEPIYDIYDYSDKIRSTPYENLTPLIESLTEQLIPNADF